MSLFIAFNTSDTNILEGNIDTSKLVAGDEDNTTNYAYTENTPYYNKTYKRTFSGKEIILNKKTKDDDRIYGAYSFVRKNSEISITGLESNLKLSLYGFDSTGYMSKKGKFLYDFKYENGKYICTFTEEKYFNGLDIDGLAIIKTGEETKQGKVTIGTLTNCTCNYKNGDNIDNSKNIVITAKDGYTFDNSYTYQYDGNTLKFVLSETKRNISILTSNLDTTKNIIIGDINPLIAQKNYTISYKNLTNCTCNYNNGDYISKSKNIIITANENCLFSDEENYTYLEGNDLKDFTLSTDKKTLTANVSNISDNIVITDISAIEQETPTTKGTISITGKLVNCVCNYSDGENIQKGKSVIITANTGYEFTGTFTLEYNGFTEQFTNEKNKLVYSILDDSYNVVLNDNYTATQKTEIFSEWVQINDIDKDKLNALSNVRFYDTNTGETKDLTSNVYKLYRCFLPSSLDNNVSEDAHNILFGKYDTNVKSKYFLTDNIPIDLGEIKVPYKYNNVYDFLNVDCLLHVLNVDEIINLNPRYCIGQTLKLQGVYDLYNGYLTLEVFTSLNNYQFSIFKNEFNLAQVIPYMQENGTLVGDIDTNNYEFLSTQYLEIIRKTPYYTNNFYGKNVVLEDVLKENNSEYVEIEKCTLAFKATNQEKNMIERLLANGIFLK